MATLYLRSAAAGAGTGADWANAFTTLVAAAAAATNADTIWVADDHAESQTGTMTIVFPTSPGLRVLCANTHVTEPPTGLATSASVSIGAGSVAMFIRGCAYVYGVTFNGGTNSSSTCFIGLCDTAITGALYFEQCSFYSRTSSAAVNTVGPTGGAGLDDVSIIWKDCKFKFTNVGTAWSLQHCRFLINGLSYIDGAGVAPTTPFRFSAGAVCDFQMDGFDLSTESSTNLIDVGRATPSRALFRNGKLPSGIAITTGSIPGIGGPMVSLFNCDSADTNYRLAIHSSVGTVLSETTIVRSGGASDGTTSTSRKMTTNSSAIYPMARLESLELMKWNDTTGSSVTATVEIVHDSQGAGTGSRFQDDEVWLEVLYLGTSGFPLGTWISDAKADVTATAADQADSSETWTTTGLTTPVTQKLSVTFTPQEKGFLHARVVMAKASKTLYYDNKLTLS